MGPANQPPSPHERRADRGAAEPRRAHDLGHGHVRSLVKRRQHDRIRLCSSLALRLPLSFPHRISSFCSRYTEKPDAIGTPPPARRAGTSRAGESAAHRGLLPRCQAPGRVNAAGATICLDDAEPSSKPAAKRAQIDRKPQQSTGIHVISGTSARDHPRSTPITGTPAVPETIGFAGASKYGASRTRTGDLLGAIQALSQLSYSPAARG